MGWFSKRKQRKLEEQREKEGALAWYAGHPAMKEKKYDEAFRQYSLAAEMGYKKAFYSVAQCYENGLGTEKNLDQAREYYEKCLDNPSPQMIRYSDDIPSRVALYRILSDESYPGYDYEAAYAYLDDAVEAERANNIYYYNANYYLAVHYARQGASEEQIIEALGFAFAGSSQCSIEPEVLEKDIERYHLPRLICMDEQMSSRGSIPAAMTLADNYADNLPKLINYRFHKGFEANNYCRYMLAKAYLAKLDGMNTTETNVVENYGSEFWAHYMALRKWDMLPVDQIKEKYADEYKRILKEGWAAERKDMAFYDKVFDDAYSAIVILYDGCTNCGKCLTSIGFTEVNGKVCIDKEYTFRKVTDDGVPYIWASYPFNKYEFAYYARECPAQCIRFELFKKK